MLYDAENQFDKAKLTPYWKKTKITLGIIFGVLVIIFLIAGNFQGQIVEWQLEAHYGIKLDHVKLTAHWVRDDWPVELYGDENPRKGLYFFFRAYDEAKWNADPVMGGYTTFYLKPIASTEEGEFYAQNLADRMDEALGDVFEEDEYVALYMIGVDYYPISNSYEEFKQIKDYNDSYSVTILTTKEVDEELGNEIKSAVVSHGLGVNHIIFKVDQETVDDLKAEGLITYNSESSDEVKEYLREKFDYKTGYRWDDVDFSPDYVYTYIE